MANQINNDKSLTHEFNVLSNILNTMKHAKLKYSLLTNNAGLYEYPQWKSETYKFSNPIGQKKQFNNCDG